MSGIFSDAVQQRIERLAAQESNETLVEGLPSLGAFLLAAHQRREAIPLSQWASRVAEVSHQNTWNSKKLILQLDRLFSRIRLFLFSAQENWRPESPLATLSYEPGPGTNQDHAALEQLFNRCRKACLEKQYSYSDSLLDQLSQGIEDWRLISTKSTIVEQGLELLQRISGADSVALAELNTHGSIEQIYTLGFSTTTPQKLVHSSASNLGSSSSNENESSETNGRTEESSALEHLLEQFRDLEKPWGFRREEITTEAAVKLPSEIRQGVGFRVNYDHQMFGMVLIARDSLADQFHPEDIHAGELILRLLAQHLSFLHDRENWMEQQFKLEILLDLSQRVGFSANYRDLMKLLLQHSYRAVPHDLSASVLRTGRRWEMTLQSVRTVSPALRDRLIERIQQTYTQMTGQKYSSLEVRTEVVRSVAFSPHLPSIENLESLFLVPLIVGSEKEVLGFLLFGNQSPKAFSEQQVGLLYDVAARAADAVEKLKKLREAQQRHLETVIQHLPIAVILLDGEHRLRFANPEAATLLPELTSSGIGEPLVQLGSHSLKQILQRSEGPFFRWEINLNTPEEENPERIIDAMLRTIERPDEPDHLLLVFQDITSLRQAQQRALQNERLAAMGEMMAGLAHESRNTLQEMQACLEILETRLQGDDDALDLVSGASRASDHLHYLYEEVRNYSAPLKLKNQGVDLYELTKLTWDRLIALQPEKEASIEFEDGDCSIMVQGDPRALEQVVRNILENALASREQAVEVKVKCEVDTLQEREFVSLSIADNGEGMTAVARKKVFEPFFTTKLNGTGLGMAIASRIIEAHHGRLILSKSNSSGTEFIIQLPKQLCQN
ncbi:Hypothetical protein PBC10988_36980 [Planctomycetales bacterium 10988]|nr:Hypothetical protein PBC10988_36980 [Planctomycetales bacterium 10988]